MNKHFHESIASLCLYLIYTKNLLDVFLYTSLLVYLLDVNIMSLCIDVKSTSKICLLCARQGKIISTFLKGLQNHD